MDDFQSLDCVLVCLRIHHPNRADDIAHLVNRDPFLPAVTDKSRYSVTSHTRKTHICDANTCGRRRVRVLTRSGEICGWLAPRDPRCTAHLVSRAQTSPPRVVGTRRI